MTSFSFKEALATNEVLSRDYDLDKRVLSKPVVSPAGLNHHQIIAETQDKKGGVGVFQAGKSEQGFLWFFFLQRLALKQI